MHRGAVQVQIARVRALFPFLLRIKKQNVLNKQISVNAKPRPMLFNRAIVAVFGVMTFARAGKVLMMGCRFGNCSEHRFRGTGDLRRRATAGRCEYRICNFQGAADEPLGVNLVFFLYHLGGAPAGKKNCLPWASVRAGPGCWFLVGFCMVSDWFLVGFWLVSGWFLVGFWLASGWFLIGF